MLCVCLLSIVEFQKAICWWEQSNTECKKWPIQIFFISLEVQLLVLYLSPSPVSVHLSLLLLSSLSVSHSLALFTELVGFYAAVRAPPKVVHTLFRLLAFYLCMRFNGNCSKILLVGFCLVETSSNHNNTQLQQQQSSTNNNTKNKSAAIGRWQPNDETNTHAPKAPKYRITEWNKILTRLWTKLYVCENINCARCACACVFVCSCVCVSVHTRSVFRQNRKVKRLRKSFRNEWNKSNIFVSYVRMVCILIHVENLHILCLRQFIDVLRTEYSRFSVFCCWYWCVFFLHWKGKNAI